MLTLKTISTGSKQGNSYALMNDNEILLLDLGVSEKEIVKAIDYRVSDIVGGVITHSHADHSKSVKNFEDMGIEMWKPYEQAIKKPQTRHFGSFKVTVLPMLDKAMEVWQHTNAKDLSRCPIYGFLIEAESQKLLYVTDCKQCVWNFKKQKINHILLGIDFQNELLADDEVKRHHVLTGHMSLSTGIDMIKANATNSLRTVILCHMSDNSADRDICIAEVQKVVNCPVYVAEKGMEIELSLTPF